MIYLSGSITNEKDYKKKFLDAAEKVKAICGNETIFNPSTIDLGKDATWQDYMKIDLKILLECSSIVMLEGWEKSKGALLEWNIARALNLKILYEGFLDD